MIRLLRETDRESVLNYLYKEKNFNIFPIGDIETFGFDQIFQKIYGEFDEENNYLSILLVYRENIIYYSHENRFNHEYLEVLKKIHYRFVSGKSELIDLFIDYLPNCSRNKMYFCHAKEIKDNSDYDKSIVRELKTKEDCEKLYDLLHTINEFTIFKTSKEVYVENKLKSMEMGHTLFIEEDGKIVSTVGTTAETKVNAMVVGVATLEGYRQRGYASTLMLALMDKYLNQKNKELCLFYDNPKAGKIYLRLGFEYFGDWDMCEIIKEV